MPGKIIHEVAFYSLGICWIAFFLGFIFRRRGPRQAEKKRSNMATLGFLLEAIGYLIVWSVHRKTFTAFLPLGLFIESIVIILAIILAVASVWLTLLAVVTLGKQWSPAARIVEGHDLLTTGPYRIVRHPIYTGMFGLMVSTGLVISKPWALGLGTITYLLGTFIRIKIEEKLLLEYFGKQYTDYKGNVSAIIPYLL
jgi:protein-S-isoprenylcysteine O-methyltransferase Ste14